MLLKSLFLILPTSNSISLKTSRNTIPHGIKHCSITLRTSPSRRGTLMKSQIAKQPYAKLIFQLHFKQPSSFSNSSPALFYALAVLLSLTRHRNAIQQHEAVPGREGLGCEPGDLRSPPLPLARWLPPASRLLSLCCSPPACRTANSSVGDPRLAQAKGLDIPGTSRTTGCTY